MKILRLTIQNVTSYRDATTFELDTGLNILIGPNGGGKTNLQKVLALTLSKYFIHQYQFRRNDQEAKVEVVDPWNRKALERVFPRFVGDDRDQAITIELAPEPADVANIKAIGANLAPLNEQLSYWEHKYPTYTPLSLADDIARASSFIYTIRNLQLEEPQSNTPEWGFLEYLRTFFVFVRVAEHVPGLELSAPVFFFSSDRALSKSFDVQASQLTEQQYFDGYRNAYQAATGDSMNLMQWGAQHFVRLHRQAVIQASSSAQTWQYYFNKFPDVEILGRYLEQLGYTWGFRHDFDQLNYTFILYKDDEELSPAMFSSGEREIVHFLLAMFALNVKQGVILVDEPELHLHPRWQQIFLGLFRDLALERQCQFVITTHSPVFVTPDTINSITRVFRPKAAGTSRIALRDVQLPQSRSLVRMINSQNNERLFFADKVVLVEGIVDRLVVASLLDIAAAHFHSAEAIEIVEVGGKGNFDDYLTILRGLLTPAFLIADRDYLEQVGSPETKALFIPASDKQWNSVTGGKKSLDRGTLITMLGEAIESNDTTTLKDFWKYLTSRFATLKSPLSQLEQCHVAKDVAEHAALGHFILSEGEMEDYLPTGSQDLRHLIAFLTNREWPNRIPTSSKRIELGTIACSILGATGEKRDSFLASLDSATLLANPIGPSTTKEAPAA